MSEPHMIYRELEELCTAPALALFRAAEDEKERESYRCLLLRVRLAAKRAWEDMGRELPPYTWENPDE